MPAATAAATSRPPGTAQTIADAVTAKAATMNTAW